MLLADPNPLAPLHPGGWAFYTTFFAVYDAVILATAARKLMAFARRDGGWKWTLPHITLASEVFIAMLRIPIMLDPTGSRRLLPWTAVEFFFTLDFSFTIATNFLIAFYWYVIFKTIMKEPGNVGLQKYKLSCGVAVAFLVILEVASSGARAAFVEARILFIFKALLYLALSFVVGVFFAKTAYKALRFRWKAKGAVGRSKERHRQDIKVRVSPAEKKKKKRFHSRRRF